MAMTDEEWAQYQREGRHLREDQRTQIMQASANEAELSDGERQLRVTTECRELLKSIKTMLVFFTVLAVLGLVFEVLHALVK
jgi:hypothetical protein